MYFSNIDLHLFVTSLNSRTENDSLLVGSIPKQEQAINISENYLNDHWKDKGYDTAAMATDASTYSVLNKRSAYSFFNQQKLLSATLDHSPVATSDELFLAQ